MKKLKLGIVSTALLLAVGGVSAAIATGNDFLAAQALDTVDCGDQCLYINEVDQGSAVGLYLSANVDNTLPFNPDWSLSYTPVSAGAVMVNGVDKTGNGPLLQKLSDNKYFFNHAGSATTGDIVTISGDWHYSDGTNDYVFTVYPALSIKYVDDTTKWDYVLEDYDRVSLLDAGMPNFEYTAINNDYDLSSYDQTRLNHFSVNNNTNSYVFEFEIEAKEKEDSQFGLRLGAKTKNWGSDHVIKLNMNGTWGPNGVMEMFEEIAEVPTKIRDFDINIAPGAKHTLGIGIVRVKNSTGHLLFVESDGAVVGRKLVKLDDREMGTRAAFYYAGSNYAIRNTIEQSYGTEALVPSAEYGYFTTQTDLIPSLNSWIDYAMTYDNNNITLNGTPLFTTETLNYMKKVGSTTYYIGMPGKDTLNVGDVLTIGGSFKFMQDNSIYHDKDGNVTDREKGTLVTPDYVARKVSFKQESFTWDGEKFVLKEDYDAAVIDAKIEAIGTVTLNSEDAINEARTAYDSASTEVQAKVSKLNVLEAAEARLAELQAAKAAAKAVDELFDSIPNLTLNNYQQDEHLVTEARDAYEALSKDAKGFVEKISLLEAAEAILVNIKAGVAVDDLIEAIGTVTLGSENAIKAARDAYNALSDKRFVTKLSVLEAAEARLAELQTNKASAEEVEELIENIGAINALRECREKIEAARTAYDALNEEAKTMVTNYGTLTDAEATFAELLEGVKEDGKTMVDEIYENLNLDKYSKSNQEVIAQLVIEAKAAIDEAEDDETIDSILQDFEADLADIPVMEDVKKGCGGSVAATSIILSSLALAGVTLLTIKRRKED